MVGDIRLRFTEDEVRLIIEALKDSRDARCVALAHRVCVESAIECSQTAGAASEQGEGQEG